MKRRIGITIGDPAGIGAEIVLKALAHHREIYEQVCPIVFGHRCVLEEQAHRYHLDIKLDELGDAASITELKPGVIFCLPFTALNRLPEMGKINPQSGALAYEYICRATEWASQRKINAIVTAPLNKQALRLAGIPYLDHTAILAAITKSSSTMTLFVTGNLRIFFYSRHIPLKDVSATLQKDKLIRSMQECLGHLQKLGISRPRLALAALNPHAGENGMFGSEEVDFLIPAVKEIQRQGLNVHGPIPADSVFHLAKEGEFDAVLSLYHDQGHIAAKTRDFYRTISFTMGLPFLRASVDHGTAMDIAGKGIANETSMVEAILAAARYAW